MFIRRDLFSTEEKLKHAAYHEAGHTVMALLAGIYIDHIYISHTGKKERCPKCSIIGYGHITHLEWQCEVPDFMTMLYAGEASEYFFLGCRNSGNQSDKLQLKIQARRLGGPKEAWAGIRNAWFNAKCGVSQNRIAIEIFAKNILEYKYLGPQAISDLSKQVLIRKVA